MSIFKVSTNQKTFVAELLGTFIVVVSATGSIVFDAKMNGALGIPFIAFTPFIGVAVGVYAFAKISMAHFNPAVSVGFLITRHITPKILLYYLGAEITGALLGSLFVRHSIGNLANLGANYPNYSFSIPIIFAIEMLATALLMAVILLVVRTKGLRGLSGLAIGGIVGLDIFFLSFISGASMNPARSLAPALLSGVIDDLWLYWSATFVGASIVAFIYTSKFH
ncbi:MAG: aquaporin [Nitrososphaerales archaeon]